MNNELMIDIETTGNKVGCKVLSLGAFGFDKNGNQVEFYRRFAIDKQAEAGLTDDQATMEWWKKQSEQARDEAFSGTTDPAEGIGAFRLWFFENFATGRFDNFRVWSCGLDFDFPILQNFMRAFGFSFPWQFWQQYDYRTIKNLFPFIKEDEGNVLKHTALEDAKAQMRGLRSFLTKLYLARKNGTINF